MSRRSISAKDIVFTSIHISLITVISFIPQVGYISYGNIAITTIPTFVALATYHIGFKGAIASSVTFGIVSYIASITVYPSPLSDPVLLIFPRLILGILIYAIHKALGELKFWKFILLIIITIILNSLLVTSFVFIVSTYRDIYRGSFRAWVIIIYINFFIELGVATTLAIILFPLTKYLRNKYIENKDNTWELKIKSKG